MIAYVNTETGRITGSTWGDSPEALKGITRVPDGCVAVYVDDEKYFGVQHDIGNYIVVDGVPEYSPAPPQDPTVPYPKTDLELLQDKYDVLQRDQKQQSEDMQMLIDDLLNAGVL